MTQEKLMLFKSWGDGETIWRIGCDCGDPSHDTELYVKIDDDGNPRLEIYQNIVANRYTETERFSWVHQAWWRIKTAIKVLTHGRVRACGEVYLNDGGLKAFKDAIEQGLDHISKAR